MTTDSFTKLFSTITTSTIWGESMATRVVWITMLAMADQRGEVQASIPGLARIANVSLEDCEAALAVLLAPDRYSRTPDHDGRRIEPIDGGWRLLNHAKYRARRSAEDRRAYKREWQAGKRQQEREQAAQGAHAEDESSRPDHGCPQVSTGVHSGQNGPGWTQAEADTEAEALGERTDERGALRASAPPRARACEGGFEGHAEAASDPGDVARATRNGAASKALRAAGVADCTPSRPELAAALDAGLTLDELLDVARELADRGKAPRLAYVTATAAGRRRDASSMGTVPNKPAPPAPAAGHSPPAVETPQSKWRDAQAFVARMRDYEGWDEARAESYLDDVAAKLGIPRPGRTVESTGPPDPPKPGP